MLELTLLIRDISNLYLDSTPGVGNLWHTARQGKHTGGLGQFVYLPRLQVRPIVTPTGRGSPLQANGGGGKPWPVHPSARAASRSPHWPGAANRGQWELQSAEPGDAAGKQTGLARPGPPGRAMCQSGPSVIVGDVKAPKIKTKNMVRIFCESVVRHGIMTFVIGTMAVHEVQHQSQELLFLKILILEMFAAICL
uniref:Uncharacterized protein n=1 Tax=Chrysemys picta bellii TaxID=8478 RepID=A0A8C3FUG0_CHRPI